MGTRRVRLTPSGVGPGVGVADAVAGAEGPLWVAVAVGLGIGVEVSVAVGSGVEVGGAEVCVAIGEGDRSGVCGESGCAAAVGGASSACIGREAAGAAPAQALMRSPQHIHAATGMAR
jgi:hypothetical protein